MRIAKRASVLIGSLFLVVVPGVTQAFAGNYPPKEPPEEVLPTVVVPASSAEASEGSLAFTGGEFTLLFVVLAVLVLAGVASLLAGRRRGSATA